MKFKINPWSLSVVLLISAITYILISYNKLPENIPMHFNAAGKADRMGTKSELFIAPVLGLIMTYAFYMMTKKLFKINPHKLGAKTEAQLALSKKMISVITLAVSILFLYLTHSITQIGLGNTEKLNTWLLPVSLLGILAPVIFYLIKLMRLKE